MHSYFKRGHMEILLILVSLLLLAGLTYFVVYASNKFNLPLILIALCTGLLFGALSRNIWILNVPSDFFSTVGLIVFILLVFNSTMKLKIKSADTTAFHSLSFVVLFASISFVCFAFFASYFLGLSALSSVILASSILGVSAGVVCLPRVSRFILALMDLESFWTTPVSLLLPLLLAVLAPPSPVIFVSDISNFLFLACVKLLTSFAVGIFIGILLSKFLTRVKSQMPAAITTAVFIAFGLADYVGGYGIFAVAALGFFFANVFVSLNKQFMEVDDLLTKYVSVLGVIMFGMISLAPNTLKFILTSILLFGLYLAIRFAAVRISHRKHAFSRKEELFLVLHAPNNSAACTVLLFLSLFPPISVPLNELHTVLAAGLMFIIYSNILAVAFAKWKK